MDETRDERGLDEAHEPDVWQTAESGHRRSLLTARGRGTAQQWPADEQTIVRERPGDLLQQDEVDVTAQDTDEADEATGCAGHEGRRSGREGFRLDPIGQVEGVRVGGGMPLEERTADGEHGRRPASQLGFFGRVEGIEAVIHVAADVRLLEVFGATDEVGDPTQGAGDLPSRGLGGERRAEASTGPVAERAKAA